MILERTIWVGLLGFAVVSSFGADSQAPIQSTYIDDMPQIPFEVEAYGRTIEVVAGCDRRKDAVTLKFSKSDARIASIVYKAVDRSFEKPGIKRVQVCRKAQ